MESHVPLSHPLALQNLSELSRFAQVLVGDFEQSGLLIEEILTEQVLRKNLESYSRFEAMRDLVSRLERKALKAGKTGTLYPEMTLCRLTVIERAVLVLAHGLMSETGDLSYDEMSKILGLNSREECGILLSRARKQFLSANPQLPSGRFFVRVPIATGASCPDAYTKDGAPWPQLLLDEELDVRRRLFIQNHVLECRVCFAFLQSTREMIYEVDRRVEEELRSIPEKVNLRLMSWKESGSRSNPHRLALSLRRFFSRPEVRWIIGAWILVSLVSYLLR